MVSLVIDTDTASDDAVAILQALGDPTASIRAITLVAGNVPLDMAEVNALVTLDIGGAEDIPVYRGCASPLLRVLKTAQFVHGTNGMSDISLPSTNRTSRSEHAVDALLEIAQTEPGEHVLVTLGPLTNIAAAITLDPLFLTRFQRVVMMLGAPDAVGNVSPTGEFNAWADPESAQITISAPGDKWLVGWDISRKYAVVDDGLDAKLIALGPAGKFAVDINAAVREFCVTTTGLNGYDLPDPIAMSIGIHPEIATQSTDVHMEVSLDPSTRGQTFIDYRLQAPETNIRIVESASHDRFAAHLLDSIGGLAT